MIYMIIFAVVMLYISIRVLRIGMPCEVPFLSYQNTAFNNRIVNNCSLLNTEYRPPLFWGKSGHLQTFVYGKLGRVKSPFPQGRRRFMELDDGATVTYDVFEPYQRHPSGEDITLAICPGIANSSESLYICTCVDYAQNAGYRVAVLNHLGSLKSVALTSPRIFTYGGTEEYGAMVDQLKKIYPNSKFMAVGFSMGGNIITKYCGESKEHEKKFVCMMAFCQGYDPLRTVEYLYSWKHLRRAYLYAMAKFQVSLLKRNADILFGTEAKEKYGRFDTEKIFASTSLRDIDEHYSSKRAGFQSLEEYLADNASTPYIKNITIPTLFLNTSDDPIVPVELFDVAQEASIKQENIIFALIQHGGHLGFFEGGLFVPETITWLDKIVVQFADAINKVTIQKSTAMKYI